MSHYWYAHHLAGHFVTILNYKMVLYLYCLVDVALKALDHDLDVVGQFVTIHKMASHSCCLVDATLKMLDYDLVYLINIWNVSIINIFLPPPPSWISVTS